MAFSNECLLLPTITITTLITIANGGMRGLGYSETESRLQNACESGNLLFVEQIARENGVQYVTDYIWGSQGWLNTCLSRACSEGHSELVSYLLSKGDDPNEKPGNRESVLLLAYEGNHAGIVQKLIDAGARLDRTENYRGRSQPIFWAVDDANLMAARMFIKGGADINVIDKQQSPIQSAILQGRREIAELLQSTGSLRVCAGRRNGDFMIDLTNCCGFIRCVWPGTVWEAEVKASCPPKTAWNEMARNCDPDQHAWCVSGNSRCANRRLVDV